MAYEGKVISGDCHIDIPWLPADLFVTQGPAHLRDRMPQVVDTDDGKQWIADGAYVGWVAGAGVGAKAGAWDPYVPGISKRMDRMEAKGFFSDGAKGLLHPTDPDLRIKDQEIDGIAGEVIYGALGLGGGGLFEFDDDGETGSGDTPGAKYSIHDPEVINAVYEVYNDWVAGFCKSRPGRFAALACISERDPQIAMAQLRKGAEAGLQGAEINIASSVDPIYYRSWDPLWELAAEHNMPVSFHTGGVQVRYPRKEDRETYESVTLGVGSTMGQLAGAEQLSSIIFSGACDRYPDFKFVLGECGIGWIPYILYRMDDEYERWNFPDRGLPLKPSEYWRRQGYSTFQVEYMTNEMVEMTGEDNIMWGSDYPHGDGVWPDSRAIINDNLGTLDEDKLKKIVCDNTAKLYGFPA